MRVLTRRFPNGEESHCTARCYNSTCKKCTCICKGLLHGKGEAYAYREASRASYYLNLTDNELTQYWPASELIVDTGGR